MEGMEWASRTTMDEKLSNENMKYLMASLNEIAYDLCEMHSITYCID
jgi:hypothetical protein